MHRHIGALVVVALFGQVSDETPFRPYPHANYAFVNAVAFSPDGRVLAVRVGRTVSVLDVSFTDVRPPKDDVVALGELAAERLG